MTEIADFADVDDPLNALNPLKESVDRSDLETGAILGAAVHVHKALGPGFLEAVYQSALAVEFAKRGIKFQREVALPIWYDGQWLDVTYRVDFVCAGILVELKAVQNLTGVEESQLMNYLHAKKGGRGLLLNFATGRLQARRFVV